ncbi:MAG: Peptide deformylase, partial [uncultured Sphingomonadaceae bacterium]
GRPRDHRGSRPAPAGEVRPRRRDRRRGAQPSVRHVRNDVRCPRHRPCRDPGRGAPPRSRDRPPRPGGGRRRARPPPARLHQSRDRLGFRPHGALQRGLSVDPRAVCRGRPPRPRPRALDGPGRPSPRGGDGRPPLRLPPARDRPSGRRALHRPPVAAEARNGDEEARQVPRGEQGGL